MSVFGSFMSGFLFRVIVFHHNRTVRAKQSPLLQRLRKKLLKQHIVNLFVEKSFVQGRLGHVGYLLDRPVSHVE